VLFDLDGVPGRQFDGRMRLDGHGVGVGEGFALACGTASVTASELAGLSSSATKPARRTVAATAPRRAALIGRAAAGGGCGTSS
jgi:hypothetical protein